MTPSTSVLRDPSTTRWEAHEISGLTARLILAYVERRGGRAAVDETLALAELAGDEDRLRDATQWRDFDTHMRLFEAASVVLGDPDLPRRVGASAIELNVAPALQRTLRALGGPRTVYGNIGRLAQKFIWTHRWELLQLGDDHASLRYADVAGTGYHHADCRYNVGLLESVPAIFGLLPARIRHPLCALRGADACVYEIRWDETPTLGGGALGRWGLTGLAGLAAARGLGTARAPALVGVAAVSAALAARRTILATRQRQRALVQAARDQREAAEALVASVHDLASDLRLDEVLRKVTRNAQAAAVGKEFSLLVTGEGGLRAHDSSRVPPSSLDALERWATSIAELLDTPVTLPDLTEVPPLATLPADPRAPLGALHAAPLRYRGERLGVLLALAHGTDEFHVEETDLLAAYADQAAVAIANARLVERLETLASQDPLTALLNYREFHGALDREVERGRRYDRSCAVVLFDLDGFKQVNDQRGHAEGDRVLRAVAAELRAACRSSDTAYRLGGDEFALLLPESTLADAHAVAGRVRAAVEALAVGIGVSFGSAQWPQHGPGKDELLARADGCLYETKRGRSRSGIGRG